MLKLILMKILFVLFVFDFLEFFICCWIFSLFLIEVFGLFIFSRVFIEFGWFVLGVFIFSFFFIKVLFIGFGLRVFSLLCMLGLCFCMVVLERGVVINCFIVFIGIVFFFIVNVFIGDVILISEFKKRKIWKCGIKLWFLKLKKKYFYKIKKKFGNILYLNVFNFELFEILKFKN